MTASDHATNVGRNKLSSGDGGCSWRKTLPASMVPKSEMSVWSVLKKCMGKDLTRISIPVVFNEPLSFLQRLAEYMEYAELLEKASKCFDATERFEYVAAFIVSSLSCNYMRLSKPFNPLWFETYELDRSEQSGYRFIAEQVSHHPPKSAFHAESKSYEFDGVVSPRLKFWGTCIEVQPSGNFQLKFLNNNETYTWKTLNVTVHNIVMGQMYIQLEGQLHIQCSTGLECKLSFKNSDSGPSRQSTFFEGFISKGKGLRAVYGNWTTFFATCEVTNFEFRYGDWLEIGKQFFQDCSAAMYNFTSFTLLLNDPSDITDLLPPTDSRRRPDIRLLEGGQIEAAEKEKERLEVKQRQARALMKKTQEKLPRWFTNVHTISKDQLQWMFTYKYWNRDYFDCEDIF
ncbi:unnamed protein product [Litomosoides sigmodontis]|uniref:Oxysterol-binding protein n=1 Tax=Litomosoides sigmodontis TaxID=42156 RepID=A0A3P6S886_LITSI|nr:unnamed protein product [Litomosoides sigmodontis]VDK72122.1 unnamed protein product [Litomosoides sigmodontis]